MNIFSKIWNLIKRYYAVSVISIICLYLFLPYRIYSFIDPSLQREENWILSLFVISMFLLILLIQSKKKYIVFNKLDVYIIVFFIYVFIRSWGNLELITFTNLTILCMLYIIIRIMKPIYTLFLIFLIILSTYLQIIIGYERLPYQWNTLADVTGVYFNSGILGCQIAIAMLSVLIFNIYWCLSRYIVAFSFLLLLIPLIYADSRASWLSLLISISYIVQKRWFSSNGFCKKYWFLMMFLLLVLLILLFSYKIPSAQGRLYIWFISLQSSMDNILLGSGMDSFQAYYMSWQEAFFRANPDSNFSYLADEVTVPYNEFLKMYVENGLVGFVLLGILVFNIFKIKNTLVCRKKYAMLSKGILLCIFSFSFFSYPFSYVQFRFWAIVSLALLASSLHSEYRIHLSSNASMKLIRYGVLFLGGVFLYQRYNYFQIEKSWNIAMYSFPTEKVQSINCMQQISERLSENSFFLSSYAAMRKVNGEYDEAIRLYKKSLEYKSSYYTYIELGKCCQLNGENENALECWKTASFMIPSRFLPVFLCAKLYLNSGDLDKAQKLKKILLHKKRKVDAPEIDRMLLELATEGI